MAKRKKAEVKPAEGKPSLIEERRLARLAAREKDTESKSRLARTPADLEPVYTSYCVPVEKIDISRKFKYQGQFYQRESSPAGQIKCLNLQTKQSEVFPLGTVVFPDRSVEMYQLSLSQQRKKSKEEEDASITTTLPV